MSNYHFLWHVYFLCVNLCLIHSNRQDKFEKEFNFWTQVAASRPLSAGGCKLGSLSAGGCVAERLPTSEVRAATKSTRLRLSRNGWEEPPSSEVRGCGQGGLSMSQVRAAGERHPSRSGRPGEATSCPRPGVVTLEYPEPEARRKLRRRHQYPARAGSGRSNQDWWLAEQTGEA